MPAKDFLPILKLALEAAPTIGLTWELCVIKTGCYELPGSLNQPNNA